MFWKQQFPLIFCFAFGVFAIIAYFSPVLYELNEEYIMNWALVIFGSSMALGIYSLLSKHFFRGIGHLFKQKLELEKDLD